MGKIEDSKDESSDGAPGNSKDKHYDRVLKLYGRILRNETQGLSHQFDMFRDFVKDHAPKQLLEINEFLAMRKEVLASLAKEKERRRRSSGSDDDPVPGDETEHFAISAEAQTQTPWTRTTKEQKKIFKETE